MFLYYEANNLADWKGSEWFLRKFSILFFFFFKKPPFSTKWSLQIKVVPLQWFWTLIYNRAVYCLKEVGLEGSTQNKAAMAFTKSITHFRKRCATEWLKFPNGKPSGLQTCALMYLIFELLSPHCNHESVLSQLIIPCSRLVRSMLRQWATAAEPW